MELTDEKLRQVIKQVIAEECDPNRVQVSVSNHHIHLTKEDFKTLFPHGKMEAFKPLKQPGEYATANVATIVGPAGKIEHVRVLGPCRSHSQVEIARSEAIAIGVDAPIRLSGHLDGTPSVKLVTPDGQVDVQGVIVAKRHIHMSDDDAKRLGVKLGDTVCVEILSKDRRTTFNDVIARPRKDFVLEMHIDTDEANAANVGMGSTTYGRIIVPDKK
ncbi:phosphate propanoyltransferase [Secundilactobacillus yichangensis]|uniref:phosphate propanoyltransferase n=1 Tax=Secundilactobacillus yichangensis TaxID=2799580 RepID=UPI0019418E11|nr:phosphate propanoyltransferase [Secundilactobacillus yichangensis]